MDYRNGIQDAVEQLGEDSVRRLLNGMALTKCTSHGHHVGSNCPSCAKAEQYPIGGGEGTTASEVEHFISLREGNC